MKILAIHHKTEPGTAATATVEIEGQVRTLPATEGGDAANRHYTIHGLAVRYRTGTKIWPGHAMYWPASDHVNNVCGPQDHRARKHELRIVGFWCDIPEDYQSEHSSVRGR